MISLHGVSVTYPRSRRPALQVPHLEIPEGSLALVIGPTGSGKSTLLGTLNGHVPHFTGGTLTGDVVVAGRNTRDYRPRDFAETVGVVGQDPLAGFVTDTVEEELAYGMEQLGLPAALMRQRVEETLDLLGIADLRDAALMDLSGGQQQRVAIGSVLTAHPSILVLDEPTSALDPTAAEDVLATVTRLVHDVGLTVVMAEHRLERVIHAADLIVTVGETVESGTPHDVMADSLVAPPVVQLARTLGWSPIPLSVREARRAATQLRQVCASAVAAGPRRGGSTIVEIADLQVRHGPVVAVAGVDVQLDTGHIVGLMGRNGAGKSSLLWAIHGAGRPAGGTVRVTGHDPNALSSAARRKLVGLVPQNATDLLYLDTVAAELEQADAESGAAAGTARQLLDSIVPGISDNTHPRDLSEGQRLALVLAIQLTADPPVILLDEPTRGLDYAAKDALSAALASLRDRGRLVVVASHDVEFIAGVADRVLVMAQGEVVADGDTAAVVTASPAFAPQVAKIMSPVPLLTVAAVAVAVGAASETSQADG